MEYKSNYIDPSLDSNQNYHNRTKTTIEQNLTNKRVS